MESVTNVLGCGYPVKFWFVYAISANIFGKADGGGLARQRKQTDISQESYSPDYFLQCLVDPWTLHAPKPKNKLCALHSELVLWPARNRYVNGLVRGRFTGTRYAAWPIKAK